MTGAVTTCESCGAEADPHDKFCGVCGEFLEWDADPNAADPPAAVPERSEPPPAARPAPPPPVAPVAASAPPRATPSVPAPTGMACASCGTDNDPKRNFCRHCGTALRAPGPARKESLRERRRRRRARPAGYRRRPRRALHLKRYLLIPAVAFAVLVLLAAFPARPIVGPWIESVRDRVTDSVPATPASVAASSESTSAEHAFDGLSNDYWAPDLRGDGVGEWIEAELDGPRRLVYLVVSPGISRNQEEFLSQARPAEIELRMFTADGGVEVREFALADSAEPQTLRIGVGDVTGVRLTILGTHGHEPGRAVAIAELEYFVRA